MQREMENTKDRRGLRSLAYKRSRLFEEVVLKSWWVLLFILLCFFAYDRALAQKKREEQRLKEKLISIAEQKAHEIEKADELALQIASSQDPAFIELALMRRLGLVPEGQTKVHFVKSSLSP